jgi:hypothetical protein
MATKKSSIIPVWLKLPMCGDENKVSLIITHWSLQKVFANKNNRGDHDKAPKKQII